MISLALVIAAALAADTPPPPAPAVSAAAPAKSAYDPDKVVCKYIAVTGTRFPSKECHRQGDWDQLAADSKKVTADSQTGFTANRH